MSERKKEDLEAVSAKKILVVTIELVNVLVGVGVSVVRAEAIGSLDLFLPLYKGTIVLGFAGFLSMNCRWRPLVGSLHAVADDATLHVLWT